MISCLPCCLRRKMKTIDVWYVLTEADDGTGVGGSLIGIADCIRAEISGRGDGHFASRRLCR